jgi:hypothetical protein
MNSLPLLRVLAFALAFSSTAVAQQNKIGIVLEIGGNCSWTVNDAPVVQGQGVPAAGILRFKQSSENSRGNINIVLLNNNNFPAVCETGAKPYQLPDSLVDSKPFFDRLMEAASRLFGQSPEKYIPTLARGGQEQPIEKVVALNARELSLSPVLLSAKPGRYRLEFQAVHSTGAVRSVEVLWNPEKPSPAKAGDLDAGLYDLTILPAGQIAASPVSKGWILAVPHKEYAGIESGYRQLLAAVEQWGPAVSSKAKTAFLRAGLHALAAGIQ